MPSINKLLSPTTVEEHIRALVRGCKSKVEAQTLIGAYLRETKGKDTLKDKVLLARKRKELGLKKPETLLSSRRDEIAKSKSNWSRNDLNQGAAQRRVLQQGNPGFTVPAESRYSNFKEVRSPEPLEESSSSSEDESDKKPQPKPAVTRQRRKPPTPKPPTPKPATPPPAVHDELKTPPPKKKQFRKRALKSNRASGDSTSNVNNASSEATLNESRRQANSQLLAAATPEPGREPSAASSAAESDKSDTEDKTPTNKVPKTQAESAKGQLPKSKPAQRQPKKVAGFDDFSSDSEDERETRKKAPPVKQTKTAQKPPTPPSSSGSDSGSSDDSSSESDSDSSASEAEPTKPTPKASQPPPEAKRMEKEKSFVAEKPVAPPVPEVGKEEEVKQPAVKKDEKPPSKEKPSKKKKEKAVTWNKDVTSPTPSVRRSKKRKNRHKDRKPKEKLDPLTEHPEEEKESSKVPKEKTTLAEERETTPVVEEKPLAGPFYPSTLSLQSRKSHRQAEEDLQPTAGDNTAELQGQLAAVEKISELPREVSLSEKDAELPKSPPTPPPKSPPAKPPSPSPRAEEKRNLSPYRVLPEIPPAASKPKEDSQGKPEEKPKSAESLLVYAKPHKKSKPHKPREKKDFGPYMEALDKLSDNQLQYVIAKTGVQLGVEQPITVLRARQSMTKAEKKSKNLDKKILRRLQKGVYAKRVDKFLSEP